MKYFYLCLVEKYLLYHLLVFSLDIFWFRKAEFLLTFLKKGRKKNLHAAVKFPKHPISREVYCSSKKNLFFHQRLCKCHLKYLRTHFAVLWKAIFLQMAFSLKLFYCFKIVWCLKFWDEIYFLMYSTSKHTNCKKHPYMNYAGCFNWRSVLFRLFHVVCLVKLAY